MKRELLEVTKDILNKDILESYIEFIYDRQLIYHKKEVLKEPFPWTDDPILRDHKFCNVFRHTDKVSRLLLEELDKRDNPIDKILCIVFFRILNRPDSTYLLPKSCEDLLENYDDYISLYQKHLDDKRPLFSDAYIITYPAHARGKGTPKFILLLELGKKLSKEMLSGSFDDLYMTTDSELVLEFFRGLDYIGPFLGGQIVSDVTYTKIVSFTPDDFTVIGPGAYWMLASLIGYEKDQKPRMHLLNEGVPLLRWLSDNQEELFEDLKRRTGKDFYSISVNDDIYQKRLDVMLFQNCCCEFRKYQDWSLGKGKRKKYKPQ